MAMIGEWVKLVSVRERPAGVWLDAGELGEVLLPRREMPDDHVLGGEVEVFLHTDSDDRPVAAARRPLVMPGSWGMLRCVAVSKVGTFMDWGLTKDLLVPYGEQTTRMQTGRSYPVWVKVDAVTERIVGSTRIARHLGQRSHSFRAGEAVKLVIVARTKLGYQAVVDNQHIGMLFADRVFEDLRIGEHRDGFIAAVRPDGKIDLSLHQAGRARVDDLQKQILTELDGRGGFWGIGDHSSPAEIREELGVSKRAFKQAVGALLKKGEVKLETGGMRRSRSDASG